MTEDTFTADEVAAALEDVAETSPYVGINGAKAIADELGIVLDVEQASGEPQSASIDPAVVDAESEM